MSYQKYLEQFKALGGIKKVDPVKLLQKIPNKFLRLKTFDQLLNFVVPFNRGLGLEVLDLTENFVKVRSRSVVRRRNHVGSAHACFLALMGEYPAGLMVLQRYPFDRYRMIISALAMDYQKQGRGVLFSEVVAPIPWPEVMGEEGERWIDLETRITNDKNELVATCKTKWQVKPWELVKSKH